MKLIHPPYTNENTLDNYCSANYWDEHKGLKPKLVLGQRLECNYQSK